MESGRRPTQRLDQHRPKDGRPLVGTLAGTEAHARHDVTLRKHELGVERRHQGGACGRHQLTLDLARSQRQTVRTAHAHRRRNRHGHDAVLAAHGSAPLDEHGHDRALDANQIDENRRRHDIRDRIDRPHLVEVHLLDRQAVGLGLGLGEDAKGAAGECGGPRSERGGLDDGEDVGEVAMGMVVGAASRMIMMVGMVVGVAGMVVMALMVMIVAMVVAAPALPAVDVTVITLARMLVPMQVRHVVVVVLMRLVQHHIEVQARNARLGHAAHLEGESLDRQSRQRGAHGSLGRLRILGRIDQGGHEHVARDTGLAVEPQRAAAASGVASGAIRQ